MRWAAKQIDPALTHEHIRALWCAMWSAAPAAPAQAEAKPAPPFTPEERKALEKWVAAAPAAPAEPIKVWCDNLRGYCGEANARLIAAAPELLEALNKINDWACFASEEDIAARLMALQQIGVHARAAIAKATGEQA
jgi:hypothetical protein